MKKVMIIALLLVCIITPASAVTLYDEQLVEGGFSGGSSYVSAGGVHTTLHYDCNKLYFNKIESVGEVSYIGIDYEAAITTWAPGIHQITYNLKGIDRPATLHVSYGRNALMQHVTTRHVIYFDNWDSSGLTGGVSVSIPSLAAGSNAGRIETRTVDGDSPVLLGGSSSLENLFSGKYHIVCASSSIFKNNLKITDNDGLLTVNLYRNVNGISYSSGLSIFDTANRTVFSDISDNDIHYDHITRDIDRVVITTPFGSHKIYPITGGAGGLISNPATVYVQNSQTGALIADTNLSVNLYGTETWYNSTLEWGWDSIQLPAGNYVFYAEKSGFTQYAPGRLTVDGVDDNINILLYPDVATPPAGNLTLQFWVCDSNSNGIPYAELSVLGLAGEGADYDSGIIQTNNLGYATLTAPGNSTYTAYASKPGYTAGENEFGVTTASPVHITVMLMAGAVPTHTAVTPTITVEPTPTQTTPIQEDNLIGLSVKGLAKGFGIDYDTALLLFGLMIIFGAGGIVMSSVKGGAMEFIAGSIVGTFVAFALGLIPIWIFIIIAVVFGAYVLRVFIQGGGQ